MTDNATTHAQIQFPPIPLVSGQVFQAEDGTEQVASGVSVVIRFEDGETVAVPLDFRLGG